MGSRSIRHSSGFSTSARLEFHRGRLGHRATVQAPSSRASPAKTRGLDRTVKNCLDSSLMTTIDKDALKQRYAEERAKRLRPDGNAQYLQLKDQLAHYLEDPYAPLAERAPKTDRVTGALIGGGFGRFGQGGRLKDAGVDDGR